MKRLFLISLFSLSLISCNKDPYYCLEVDEKKTNSDCTCKIKENEYEIIDNIDGIDSYTRCRVEYNYPFDGGTRLDYLKYYSKKEETNEEIAQLGIKLVKYVFNLEKYDYIVIPRNGGGPSPYYYWIVFNNGEGENVPITLTITDYKAIDIYSSYYACFKNPKNKHLYIGPGIHYDSMPEEIKNKINKILEITDKYLEDKPARLINP